jgi:hypothetical protein
MADEEKKKKGVAFKLIAGLKKKGYPNKEGEKKAKDKIKKKGIRSLLSW